VLHLTHNLPYLLTAALALLAVPALAWHDRAWPGSVWLETALALGAAAVTAAYLVTAQRAVRGRLGLRGAAGVILRVPALIALTAGISLSQSRAVLEGLAGRPSEFIRTPKHGVVDPARLLPASAIAAPAHADAHATQAPPAGYAARAGRLPILEIVFAAYLAVGLAYALASQRFMAAPILGLFAIGFACVGASSVVAGSGQKKRAARR
jgi:hypothetical protein